MERPPVKLVTEYLDAASPSSVQKTPIENPALQKRADVIDTLPPRWTRLLQSFGLR